MNAVSEWRAGRATIALGIDNIFDERYATFGLLAEADDVLGNDYDDPLFIGPGAPRSVRLLITVR